MISPLPTKCVLTIAGTDPSGAAGVQVDLQVFRDFGAHGLSVITAVVWQNTVGVRGYEPMSAEVVRAQLHAVWDDIVIDAVKIGMMPTACVVGSVADFLEQLGPGRRPKVVLDPVLVSGDGRKALTESDTLPALKHALMKWVDVLTPNVPEAEALLERTIQTQADLLQAARDLRGLGCKSVLLKGGHLAQAGRGMVDAYADASESLLLEPLPAIDEDVRGTGCQLASAVAAGLANGLEPAQATRRARTYLNALLLHQRHRPGKGRALIARINSRPLESPGNDESI